jgi:Domain of unknown function (DUF5134)
VAGSLRSAGRLSPAAAHHVPHLVMSGAMVYMLAVAPGPAPASGAGGAGGPAGAGGVMGPGGAAAGGAHSPLLAVLLATFLASYVMWAAGRLPALAPVRAWRVSPDRLAAASPQPSLAVPAAGPPTASPAAVPPPSPPLSLRLAACCNIAMGVVMGYMLIVML